MHLRVDGAGQQVQAIAIDDQLAVAGLETASRSDAADQPVDYPHIAVNGTPTHYHHRVANQQVSGHALT